MVNQSIMSFSCIYLVEKVHVNLSLSLPGIIICKYKQKYVSFNAHQRFNVQKNIHRDEIQIEQPVCFSTCNILLKNNFGSFEEVLPDDKYFISSSR